MTIRTTCPISGCRRHLGLAGNLAWVRQVCPTHGTVAIISRKRLNGMYEAYKIGGSGGDEE